jgi:hypothetical protein
MSWNEKTKRLLKLLEERLEVDRILSDNLESGFKAHFHEAEDTEEFRRIITTEIIFLEQIFNKTYQYYQQKRDRQETLDEFFE